MNAYGASDPQGCYEHALSKLITAGTELDRVGMELEYVWGTFNGAINEYFIQLQSQIDNKDKAIRLMIDQKLEIYYYFSSLRDQLIEVQDENVLLKTENLRLTGLTEYLKAKLSESWHADLQHSNLPGDMEGILDSTNSFTTQNQPCGESLNGTEYNSPIPRLSLNRELRLLPFRDYGNRNLKTLAPRPGQRREEREGQDKGFDAWKKSATHICPETTAAFLRQQDARQRHATQRCLNEDAENEQEFLREVRKRALHRLEFRRKQTLDDIIDEILSEQCDAYVEEARQQAWEDWKNSASDTSPDTTRIFLLSEAFLYPRTQYDEFDGQGSSEHKFLPQASPSPQFPEEHSQPQVAQRLDFQQYGTRELKAGGWEKNKTRTPGAMESFHRQQVLHGWTKAKDEISSSEQFSKRTPQATQSKDRRPQPDPEPVSLQCKEHSASLLNPTSPSFVPSKVEDSPPPSKEHSGSLLNPTSPSFIPFKPNDEHARVGRKTPPHKRAPKIDSSKSDSHNPKPSAKAPNSAFNATKEVSIPPHKRFSAAANAPKAPASVGPELDLIALDDEIDPVTATRQYTFKATPRKGQVLDPLDPNLPQPPITGTQVSLASVAQTTASSSLRELQELQTGMPAGPSPCNTPSGKADSFKLITQRWLDLMPRKPNGSSESNAQSSKPVPPRPAANNTFSHVHESSTSEKPKMIPGPPAFARAMTSGSPVKDKINAQADSRAGTGAENISSLDNQPHTPVTNAPSIIAKHNIDVLPKNKAPTPAATNVSTSSRSQDSTVPKRVVSNPTAFMAAALNKFSTFSSKYAKDPESDTRKELAAKAQVVKEKLASEASTIHVNTSSGVTEEHDHIAASVSSNNTPEDVGILTHLYKQGSDTRPAILGTRILGEFLDRESKRLVVMPNRRGEWFQMELEWKPAVMEGKTCWRL